MVLLAKIYYPEGYNRLWFRSREFTTLKGIILIFGSQTAPIAPRTHVAQPLATTKELVTTDFTKGRKKDEGRGEVKSQKERELQINADCIHHEGTKNH